jgi:hypothetical protein
VNLEESGKFMFTFFSIFFLKLDDKSSQLALESTTAEAINEF